MNVVFKSEIGSVRAENQDRVKVNIINQDVALAVLCDGMGGQNAGSIASDIAINLIFEKISASYRDNSDDNSIKNIMMSSVVAANSVIFNKANQDEDKYGMGTTCVAVLIANQKAHIVNVGDSRAYIISDNGIKQLTNDHTFVKMLFDEGKIQEHEMKSHPKRNYITKAVGVESNIEPDYYEENVFADDIILLCSDGLSNYCTNEEMLQSIQTDKLEDSCNSLIKTALDNNSKDNVSLAIVHI